MADDRSFARRRREPVAQAQLPYARHVSDAVIALDSGALMMTFQLDGAAFETADVRDLNDWHVKLNQAWRNLADDRLAVWHHLVRHTVEPPLSEGYASAFAAELGAAYDARIASRRLWTNTLYVTLVLHPGRDAQDRAAAVMARLKSARRKSAELAAGALERLEEAGRDLEQYLHRYRPRQLGIYERDGLWFSETMEALRLVLTGRPGPIPLVFGHLGEALYTVRAIFGRETIELRDVADTRYAGVLAIKEYPATNGAVVLLERGTRVLGEYRGGLQQGRRRLFVLWTRAVSPTGVAVGLASPASDALGRAGFDGQVDGHFWDRFGGALLLSLVDDAAYAGFGDGDSLRSTARVPSDAAAAALQGSVDIPATLRKAQGSEVSIFVAQDLDFSGVYRLRARR